MQRFEIDRNGERFEVEAPDHESALNAFNGLHEGTRTTGETLADVATRGMGGVNRLVASTAMLPFRASAWLTGTQGRGFEGAGDRVLNPWLNQPEPETRAGRYAEAAGEALGASVLPAAGIMRAASKVPLASQMLPTLADRFLRPVATAPGAATAIDVAAATGAGLAQEGAREQGAPEAGQTLASLAGGIVPVVGVTAAARQLPRAGEALANRIGIRASADGAEPQLSPQAIERAAQMIGDALSISNTSPDKLRLALAEADRALNFGPNSSGQNALALVDLDEHLQRLAGSAARQHPEAWKIIKNWMRARQTGQALPEDQLGFARAGLPTRQRHSAALTGEQAQRTLGSTFGAPLDRPVPMGQIERVADMLKRALRIRDEDHHGHLANAYRTEQQIIAQARVEANKLYGEVRNLSQGYDIRPHIEGVLKEFAAQLQSPDIGPTTARILRRGLREFENVRTWTAFDEAKRSVDALIEKALRAGDTNVGRILRGNAENPGLLRRLLDAVDLIEHNGIGAKYNTARGVFSSNEELREAIELGRRAFRDNSDVTADHFESLSNEAQQKLFRLGALESFEQNFGGGKRTRDVTQVFESPRVQTLIERIIPRSKDARAEFADRPVRFGRAIENEQRMIETRNVVQGGSPTARNLADDERFEVLNSVIEQFKNNPSVMKFGQVAIDWAIRKTFGMRADTAQALAQMLFNADPVQRAAILARVEARMGPQRMLRFNQALHEAQQAAFGATTAQTPSVAPSSEGGKPR